MLHPLSLALEKGVSQGGQLLRLSGRWERLRPLHPSYRPVISPSRACLKSRQKVVTCSLSSGRFHVHCLVYIYSAPSDIMMMPGLGDTDAEVE